MGKPEILTHANGYTIRAAQMNSGEKCECPDKDTVIERVGNSYKLTAKKGKIISNPNIRHK